MQVFEADVRVDADCDAELLILTTDQGRKLLDEVRRFNQPKPAELVRWNRIADKPFVAAAIRLAEARRKAKAKFTRADQMWLSPIGVEQSTGETVARYKAIRFDVKPVVDLCAGIGGDTTALAQHAQVIAVDIDPAMCRRVAWNANVYDVADKVLVCRGEAERFAIPAGHWVHLDPDRRSGRNRRATAISDYQPGPGYILSMLKHVEGGAIKLGPASDFASLIGEFASEIELISLEGECKEATIWFGAPVTCSRRATRLPEGASWTDRDGPKCSPGQSRISHVLDWVYDPDPALCRSGLVDSFAVAHGLSRLDPRIDYLTGRELVRSPFLDAFQVLEILPLDLKRLKRRVQEQGIGPLEIKVRGLDVTPEVIRSRLRPRGISAATLILAGCERKAAAILARRIPRPLIAVGSGGEESIT